jgi:hypothetical protein
MADIKMKYPSGNNTPITITLNSLASTSAGVLLAGAASLVVPNDTTLDLDHLLSGKIRVGTGVSAGRVIEVWVYAPVQIEGGVPTYPDTITGAFAATTLTSQNVKFSALRLAWSTMIDGVSDRDYFIPPTSIAGLFGDMPSLWGVFLTHDTGAALNATAGNHSLSFQRIQRQSN